MPPEDKTVSGEKPENALSGDIANLYQTFGAVQVKPQSFFRLLQRNESVLLYPGGVREVTQRLQRCASTLCYCSAVSCLQAFKRRNEKYELFWPQKPEFVRMAARFNATVVPISTVGFEDSIQLLVDSDEMKTNPFFGGWCDVPGSLWSSVR